MIALLISPSSSCLVCVFDLFDMGNQNSAERPQREAVPSEITAYDIVNKIVPKEAEKLLNEKVRLRERLRQIDRELEKIAARHGNDQKTSCRS